MLRNVDFRKWIILGLLILQIGWIGNHIRLVASDQINPWRLGGYAMYTVPNPNVEFWVYEPDFSNQPIPVNTVQYEAATRLTNATRTFRCAGMSSAALLAFFNENRNLIGRNLLFVFGERRFVRSPPSTKGQVQGTVAVTWQDRRSFTHVSKFCGSEHVETAVLP